MAAIYDTAFFRKDPHLWQPLASVAQSLVFDALRQNRLNYIEDIVSTVLNNKENDSLKSAIQVITVLRNLIEDGFVGEVHGIKLEKFLKTV